MSAIDPEMEDLKARLKGMWMAGDFGQLAKHIETVAPSNGAMKKLRANDCVTDSRIYN